MRLLPDLAAIGGLLGEQSRAVMLAELLVGGGLLAVEVVEGMRFARACREPLVKVALSPR